MPIPVEVARALVIGDPTVVRAGEGWPHADTLDGLRMALDGGDEPGWFVTLQGLVIGDCGTHGGVDAAGDIEIGYGLAAPYRGHGYGTEVVAGLSRWLLGRPGVRRVVAQVHADNAASRRALKRAGFAFQRAEEQHLWYALPVPGGAPRRRLVGDRVRTSRSWWTA